MSRVLNGRTDVDIDLTRRVHAAVQRLGYWPSGLVRSLRMRVTTVIEIIIADVANPFFTSMVRGVEDAAQAAGYSVVFASVDEDLAKEARYIEVAAAEQMAGVILCPASPRGATPGSSFSSSAASRSSPPTGGYARPPSTA